MTYFSLLKFEWRLLIFGLTLTCLSGFGQTFFISLFNTEIRTFFDLSHTGFGSIYAIATLSSAFCIIWAGKLIDHVDLRLFTGAICLGLAAACLLIGSATNLIVLGFALFMIRLCGQGMMGHTSSTSMGRYLPENRGKAVGFTVLGHRLSEMVLPVPALLIAGLVGWQNSWLIFGIFIVLIVIPWTMWLLRGQKKRHQDYITRMQSNAPATKKNPRDTDRQWTRAEVLRDPRFYFLLPCVTCTAFIITGLFFHQETLVGFKGWDPVFFASSFTAYALAGIASTIISGAVVDKVGSLSTLPLYLIPHILGLFVLGFTDHGIITPLVFMALSGITAGAASTTFGSLWPEIYGTLHLGAIRSILTSIMVFSSALAPPFLGWFLDHGTSFNTLIFGFAGYAILSSILALIGVQKFK